jgi:hypothetical protein
MTRGRRVAVSPDAFFEVSVTSALLQGGETADLAQPVRPYRMRMICASDPLSEHVT